MKLFIIKIDKKSIKRNPNAGERYINEYIATQGELTIDGDHEPLDEEFFRCISISGNPNKETAFSKKYTYKFHYGDKDSEKVSKILQTLSYKYKRNISYSLNNIYRTHQLMHPESPYLFKYKNTKVQCQLCNFRFSHRELGSDYDYDDDGGTYLDNICPKCNEADCCEIKHETMEDLIATKAKLPRL